MRCAGVRTEHIRKWAKKSMHLGWRQSFLFLVFFRVSVSWRFFHQSASINSSNAALQLCSMRYITLSKRAAPPSASAPTKRLLPALKLPCSSPLLPLPPSSPLPLPFLLSLVHRLHGLHYSCAAAAFTRKYTRKEAGRRYEAWNSNWCTAITQLAFV